MENLELLFTSNQDCSCLDGVCHLHKTNMQRTPQPRVSCPGRHDGPEVVEEDEIRHSYLDETKTIFQNKQGFKF